MSGLAFSWVRSAATVQRLPKCRYGHGEMGYIDEGYQCPKCNYFRSPDRHHSAWPGRRRS